MAAQSAQTAEAQTAEAKAEAVAAGQRLKGMMRVRGGGCTSSKPHEPSIQELDGPPRSPSLDVEQGAEATPEDRNFVEPVPETTDSGPPEDVETAAAAAKKAESGTEEVSADTRNPFFEIGTSIIGPLVKFFTPRGPSDETPMATKGCADAFIEIVRQLFELESPQQVKFLDELEEKLAALERIELGTVRLLRPATVSSICKGLRRFSKDFDTAGLDEERCSKVKRLHERAERLDSKLRPLIKPPPQKIKDAPVLVAGGATQTSLTLSVIVPKADTRITAYEVRVIAQSADHKLPTRWIPEGAWKDKATGSSFEWLINDLEAGTTYEISVRAYGTEEECEQRTKHWSPALVERTLLPDGDAEKSESHADQSDEPVDEVEQALEGEEIDFFTAFFPDKAEGSVLTNSDMSHVFKNSDKDAMSKDLPEDSEAFAVVKQKLILSTKGAVVHGEPWSELSTSKFRHGDWSGRKPGVNGFNKFAQEMMERHNVPATKVVSVPHGGKPCVQPYQQVVAYLAHPKSYTLGQKCVDPYTGRQSCTNPSQRMLVVHRTGAGKTCSMIRIADNYFKDKRPKILLFPSPAVCSNFYMELLNHRFPNRYADFLQREGKLDEVRSNLELKGGGLMCGRVRKEFLNDEQRPSAPLRAFSYTQAGGRMTCGDRHRINPVFKCPDGYGGGWCYGPGKTHSDEDGYEEYESDGNPLSNKIILMDEFHNLVTPSPEIRKNPTRMLMLGMLKEMLRTAKNSVIVGFTATPLVGADGTAKELLDIIKGKGSEHLTDEGFISYFMGSPFPLFPTVSPAPNEITDDLLRKVRIENLSHSRGNLTEYYKHQSDEDKAVQRCSLGQYFGTAGTLKIFESLTGASGELCGEAFDKEKPHETFGYCPDRVRGYASKLSAVCDDVSSQAGKTLVLVHSAHGFKLLLRLLGARFPGEVLGYVGCNPSAIAKWDDEIKALIGDKHSDAEKVKGCCGCHICKFNAPTNLQGEEYRIMVADAKFCSEGVSFLAVRQLSLVDMPETASDFLQRVGRAVRFNGHAGLPPKESIVRLRLYCATLPAEIVEEEADSPGVASEPEASADENRKTTLAAELKEYYGHLAQLEWNAVDFDQSSKKPLWDESSSEVDVEQAKKELDAELALEAEAIKASKEEAKAKAQAKAQAEIEFQARGRS